MPRCATIAILPRRISPIHNLVLWGDPGSNRILAKIADRLPVKWTAEGVVLGGKTYAAETHAPILIFPNPLNPKKYVVLNSGFTFREADYLSNARQTPKLPDYAIVDITVPARRPLPGEDRAGRLLQRRLENVVLLEFLRALDSGEKSADELLAQCLLRIARSEHEVRAWVEVAAEAPRGDGLLRGIPFGVKDIFETLGRATEYGSRLYEGRKGSCDALVVDTLRARRRGGAGQDAHHGVRVVRPGGHAQPAISRAYAGRQFVGFGGGGGGGDGAVRHRVADPGERAAPGVLLRDLRFQAELRTVSVEGLLAFAPSLDTVGLFTATAADMTALWSRGFGGRFDVELHRAAWMRTPAGDEMQAAMGAAVERLRAQGVAWTRWTFRRRVGTSCWTPAQAINRYEGARSQRERFEQFGERMGKKLAALIREGLGMPQAEYEDGAGARRADEGGGQLDLLGLSGDSHPGGLGPAPLGLESTGDPRPTRHGRRWECRRSRCRCR